MYAIQVENVSKRYKIYHDKGSTLKEKIIFQNRNKYEERWVLKNVSLNIEKGKTVGLIGENGSGKSTLLKLLTRIIYPTNGKISIRGKVSSLLELGAGFHPDMTGRENIYTNASIFGLTRQEIDKRLDKIINFSELEEYIDNPVRTYSSGMYMRLAFSVAINVEADILLIDEILAVGDVSFQRKCYDKLNELKKKGVTIVFVSHDSGAVQRLCDIAVWLNEGKIAKQGETKSVINAYLQYISTRDEKRLIEEDNDYDPEVINTEGESEIQHSKMTENPNRWGNRKVEIGKIDVVNRNGERIHIIKSNEPITIRFTYSVNEQVEDIVFGIAIRRIDGLHCYGTNTFIDNCKFERLKNVGVIKFKIDSFALLENTYLFDVAAHSRFGEIYDYHYEVYKISVSNVKQEQGVVAIKHKWEIS